MFNRPPAHEIPDSPGADEVVRFLEAVPSLRTRTALTTAIISMSPSSRMSGKISSND
jgi:hypothetical protein